MKDKKKRSLCLSVCFLAAFVLWTAVVCTVNVMPIGPRGSSVGLAAVNGAFHDFTGVHMTLYTVTDWLGLVPVAFGLGFAVLGLVQWIGRKSILRVDYDILALGVFYIVMLAVYLLFEKHVVNYRPVLIEGYLEASYPSSTTLLVTCVIPTAVMQLRTRITHKYAKSTITCFLVAFTLFMVVGRLVSGVHWLSDIIGGALLSGGLVMMYRFICSLKENVKPDRCPQKTF